MDYRLLGIAWPSPVTVDLLLCNMKLLYEDVSMKPLLFLKDYLDLSLLFPFPTCIYLIQQNYVQIWVSIFTMSAV